MDVLSAAPRGRHRRLERERKQNANACDGVGVGVTFCRSCRCPDVSKWEHGLPEGVFGAASISGGYCLSSDESASGITCPGLLCFFN